MYLMIDPFRTVLRDVSWKIFLLILDVYFEKLLKGPVGFFFFFFLAVALVVMCWILSLTGKTFEVVDVAF